MFGEKLRDLHSVKCKTTVHLSCPINKMRAVVVRSGSSADLSSERTDDSGDFNALENQ